MRKLSELMEKYNTMHVQAKVVLWFTVVGFFQKAVSVISTPIFTRLLTTSQYGMFSVYSAWSDILTIFITLNLQMAVMNNAFIKTDCTKEHIVSCFQGLSYVTGIFWFIMYLFFRKSISSFMKLPEIVLTFMFLSFIVYPAFLYWTIYKRYQYDYKKPVLLNAFYAIVSPAFGIIAILSSNQSFRGEARILGKISLMIILGVVFSIVNWNKDKCFFDLDLWKYALAFNLPLIPHFMSETILNQSDRIMINQFYSSAESGIYSIAYSAASLILIFSSALNSALVPWHYEQLKKENYKTMSDVTFSVLFILLVLIAFLISLAPEIIMVLAGAKYTGAVRLIPTLAASVFFNYLYQTLARVEMYYGKRIYTVIGTFVAAAVNVGLNYLLIPRFGYIMAGYTTLIAHIILYFMHWLFYRKVCITNIGRIEIFDYRKLAGLSFLMLGIGCIMTILYNYLFIRIVFIIGSIFLIFINRRKIYKIKAFILK